ncbi:MULTISPECIES: hypothetical protein [Acetobacter]|uniref:Uncharacterized protein n=2 Tax=Acetobacter TaxID=434 RepID=A0AAN1UA06_9PROT|nr:MULTISPECIES: hypothetical protein [Acetobacter]ASL39319.1 hypothetical protein CBI36_01905 [Acetobacter oryzifermentans]AXN01446.1 hypothetical protein CJF59_13470 [Acetobacter pomorum]KAA8397161.1 hypothetical protein FKW22_05165 [Acetobacter sp. DmW_125124]KAA8397707.1 hypothetical protein FKW20_08595 [Acetobacter sp. DmW_125127]KAA8401109.1 hypothetical protein FKW19_00405 [Acetobacter sp. DmW_125128]
MDQARLQAKVAKGYGKAAQRVGALTTQYRPIDLIDPMGAAAYAALFADFASDAVFSFKRPPLWDKPTAFGLFDTTDVRAGDILVAPMGTYFVARFEPFRPAVCVLTNRTASFTATGQSGSGVTDGSSGDVCTLAGYQDGYNGQSSDGSGLAEASGWPVSIILKNKGERVSSGLPGNLRSGQFEMLAPIIPGFTPRPYMTVTDDMGTEYTVDAVELSQYGNRLMISVNQI